MNRIGHLDFLRGIAIIAVVMGHTIQYNLHGTAATGCFNFIYSFHMGFFFFISGCAASLSMDRNTWNNFIPFIGKKARQLLLPFFVWGGGIPLVQRAIHISDVPNQLLLILQNPDRSVWFLLFLFCIQLVYFVCCAISAKANGRFTRLFVLLCSVPVIATLLYLKKQFIGSAFSWISPEYLLLFILGHIVQASKVGIRYSSLLSLGCFSVFVILVPLFDFSTQSDMSMRLIKTFTSITFSIGAYVVIKTNYEQIKEKVRNHVDYLGTHTLELYVTHFFIIQVCMFPWIDVCSLNPVPLFILVFIASIPVCFITIGITDILKAIPGLSLILYGKITKTWY